MPLTIHGIKSIGFSEMEKNDKIDCYFNLVNVFSIDGIDFELNSIDEVSKTAFEEEEFSFAFASSVNEACKVLFDEEFVEDEIQWKKDHNFAPPYLVIKLHSREKYTCDTGYWILEEDLIKTYNCFGKVKQDLRKIEESVVPRLISSLTIELSKISEDIKFNLIQREMFGKTAENKTLYDIEVTTNVSITKTVSIEPDRLEDVVKKAMSKFSKINPKVAALSHSGFKEEDRFKKFLNLFQALEIHTHKSFSKLDFESYVSQGISYPDQIKSTATSFLVDRIKDSRNLAQKFKWCCIIDWSKLDNTDIENFMSIKKTRDRISHGEMISDSDLPTELLVDLLLKVLNS